MPRGQAYGEETRAAVMAALLAGQSISATARQFQISKATIIAWRNAAGLSGSTIVQPEKRSEFGELVGEYLRNILTTLSVQAEQFRDPAWLKKQPASEVAVLHGVLADKAFRILEAIDAAGGEEHAGGLPQ